MRDWRPQHTVYLGVFLLFALILFYSTISYNPCLVSQFVKRAPSSGVQVVREDGTLWSYKISEPSVSKNQLEISASKKYKWLTQQHATRRLPHVLIIGVKKGGTRALLEFSRLHPGIRAAGSEIHFFDRYYSRGLEWYRRRMPPTLEGQLTMEKTPSYFVTRDVPGRVKKMNADMRLIVVLRDPTTRALSDYAQASSKKKDMRRFEELAFRNGTDGPVDTTWVTVRIGLYARHLQRWLTFFPLEQMHFVSGERMIVDPAAEMARLQDFLGLKRVVTEKHFYFNATKGFPCLLKSERRPSPHCLGKTKGRSHPHIDSLALQRLRQFYRPFNQRLYQMTGIDFGWP